MPAGFGEVKSDLESMESLEGIPVRSGFSGGPAAALVNGVSGEAVIRFRRFALGMVLNLGDGLSQCRISYGPAGRLWIEVL